MPKRYSTASVSHGSLVSHDPYKRQSAGPFSACTICYCFPAVSLALPSNLSRANYGEGRLAVALVSHAELPGTKAMPQVEKLRQEKLRLAAELRQKKAALKAKGAQKPGGGAAANGSAAPAAGTGVQVQNTGASTTRLGRGG